MKKKLVIIGASEHVNPLILKANELGFETHVFAWHADEIGEKSADFFYPISIKNKEDILEKCKEISPIGVISLGSDIAALTVSYVSEHLGLRCNSFEVTLNATNKLRTRRILETNGIPQPRFVGIGDMTSSVDCKNLSFPVIVKPTDRSGSRGVIKIKSRSDLFRGCANARDISFERKAIVEEYIFGRHYSCECISFDGNHYILAYTKRDNIEGNSFFLEHIHTQPTNFTEKQRTEADRTVLDTLNAISITNGASSVEFLIDRFDEIKVIEITPSMYGDFIGTDLVPLSTGYDYMKMIIDVACNKQPDLLKSSEGVSSHAQIIGCAEDVIQMYKVFESDKFQMVRNKLMITENDLPINYTGERYGYFIYKVK